MKAIFTYNYKLEKWEKVDEKLIPTTKDSLYRFYSKNNTVNSELSTLNLARTMMATEYSWKIIDIDRNNENKVIKILFSIGNIHRWSDNIETGLILFNQEIQEIPHIILMNINTIKKIEKLVGVKDYFFQSYKSKNGFVQVCIDNSVHESDFCLVHDTKARLVKG